MALEAVVFQRRDDRLFSGKRKELTQEKAQDTGQVCLGHPPCQTGVCQPAFQGFPVVEKRTDRKAQFCRDTGRVSQGHPVVRGSFRNFIWLNRMCLFCAPDPPMFFFDFLAFFLFEIFLAFLVHFPPLPRILRVQRRGKFLLLRGFLACLQ